MTRDERIHRAIARSVEAILTAKDRPLTPEEERALARARAILSREPKGRPRKRTT